MGTGTMMTWHKAAQGTVVAMAWMVVSVPANAENLVVPVNRSALVSLPRDMAEVMVANPKIADIHVHGLTDISVIGKQIGITTIRAFDRDNKVIDSFEVMVSYDLPAIRHALKNFLPNENIAVEMVNTNIALTGDVSSASAADKAIRIVSEYMKQQGDSSDAGGATLGDALAALPAMASGAAAPSSSKGPQVLNLMQVTNGQQVMLRVRVGEIQREALKELGIDLNAISRSVGGTSAFLGTGGGIASLVSADSASAVSVSPGVFLLPGGQAPTNTRGILGGRWQPDGANGDTVSGLLKALERDGLFKLLAEPNLVAVTGEQAEFLAGGEIPIPVVQNSSGTNANITIEYKPFGVAVRFTPYVLNENRIRMSVQPEVSDIDNANSVKISGFEVPSLTTRRAKTTVELAPGESFMIAGLIKDQTRSQIDQLPGVKELPILGALFRSTEFQRNETELVIAVTPYLVDPLKSGDVRLPTDNFMPASMMESFFYGALGTLNGNAPAISQTPSVEGPIGFMVD
jgi:pilus assembly protein CpaC